MASGPWSPCPTLTAAWAQTPGPARSYDAIAAEYRRSPSAQLLFQLGKAAADSGNAGAAQDLMRRFLADPDVDSDDPNLLIAQRIADGAHGPRGEVNVVGEPKSAVLVDGRLVGLLPLAAPLLLGAGEHQVVVERGRRKLAAPVKVIDGRETELLFNVDSDTVLFTQPPAVVLLPTLPAVKEPLATRLVQSAEQAVRRTNLAVFNTRVAQDRAPDTRSCLSTATCQTRLGERSQVDYILSVHVSAAPASARKSYELKLLLLDVGVGDFAARSQRSVVASTADVVAKELGSAVEALLHEGSARPRGTLSITSAPPGADVVIGGQTVGRTPFKRAAWAGPLAATVRLAGYLPQEVSANVLEKSQASYNVELQRAPEAPKEPRRARPRGRMIAGIVVAAGGVLLMSFGGSALSVNRQCDPAVDASKPCGYLYDTPVVGGTLLGIGGALTLGGVLLVAIPSL